MISLSAKDARLFLIAIGFTIFAANSVAQTDDISANRRRASQIFTAVSGLKISIDDSRLVEMEKLLDQNKERDAVKIASKDPAFIDNRMYNFARRLWTTTESYLVDNNDFIATVVGIARDSIDVREMLTGNYYYEYDISNLSDRDQTRFGFVIPPQGQPNNNHYESGYNKQMSMYKTLKKTSPQLIFRSFPAGSTIDSGGLLTSVSFIVANATGGTNRRMVEYTFRSFMCVEMLDWADATRPDDMVGRDVDRYAGGSNTRYQVTCKGCHTQLDAYRPAFAHVIVNSRTPNLIPAQLNPSLARNPQIFPGGYAVTNDQWKNYATGKLNADRFGFRGNFESGSGVNAFGKMISNSQGFSRCMVRRMFYEVCKRDPSASDEAEVRKLATNFEDTYKFTDLAEIIALSPSCMGKSK